MDNTLDRILQQLREEFLSLKEGSFLETLKSIYPDDKMPKKEKNIFYEGKEFTKPLALNKKEKVAAKKKKDAIKDFFEDTQNGDILKVIRREGNSLVCENVSMNQDIKNKFYENTYVYLTEEYILSGAVKRVYYKSLAKKNKYFNERKDNI